MRMRFCLEDVSLHLISPARWKMHKFSCSSCCSEWRWWVGKLKEKTLSFFLLCFGNNQHGCLDIVESL